MKRELKKIDSSKEILDQSFCEKINVEMFIESVKIRKNEENNCEYEVSENAMKIYQKYSYYSNWVREEIGCSLNYYLNHKDSKYPSKKSGYRGAFILEKDGKVVTADILTSIKKAINKLIVTIYPKNIRGETICEDLLNNCVEYKEEFNYIIPYARAFAEVYYWCGNMMPIICNYKGKDECIEKLEKIKIGFSENYNCGEEYKKFINGEIDSMNKLHPTEVYPDWAKSSWKNWTDFIKNNYFEDYVKQDKNLKNIKLFYGANNDEDKRNWFLSNTKLIIQRSYRIINNFNGEWNPVSFEPVKTIMKTVFKNAGMTDEETEEHSETWF